MTSHVRWLRRADFGVSPHFTAYPGTISIGIETFMRLTRDIVAIASGINRVQGLIVDVREAIVTPAA